MPRTPPSASEASCVRPHLPYRGEWGIRKELRQMRKEIYPLINTWAIREPEDGTGKADGLTELVEVHFSKRNDKDQIDER